jgi:hypothetical protein
MNRIIREYILPVVLVKYWRELGTNDFTDDTVVPHAGGRGNGGPSHQGDFRICAVHVPVG